MTARPGTMVSVIAAHDWRGTPLGPMDAWPAELRIALDMCLRCEAMAAIYWGPDFRILYNDTTIPVLGPKHPAALGRPAREVWHDTWPTLEQQFRQVHATGREVLGTNTRFALDSQGRRTESYFNYSFIPIVGPGGDVLGIFAEGRETTSMVTGERWLRAERERFSRMFDQAPGFFAFLQGPEHLVEFANPVVTAFVGNRDIIGLPVRQAMPELEGQGLFELLDEARAIGRPVNVSAMPVRIELAPGGPPELRYVDLVVQPVEGGLVVQGMDATDRVNAGTLARESEDRFRLIAERAPVMIWMSDADGHCLYLNKALRDFWGVAEEAVRGFDWTPTIHPDDRQPLWEPWLAGMKSRAGFSVEARYLRADGQYRILNTTAHPRFDPVGNFLGMIGVNVDVTETRRIEDALRHENRQRAQAEQRLKELNENLEARVREEIAVRRQAESALHQAQKMEAIGQLTGGVAHDFNNLLQVIGGNLQLLDRDVAGNERARQRVDNALAALNRGAKLASQLLAFGRRQALEPRTVNVGRLISGMDEMLRRILGETIEIETVIAGDLWNTFADPSQTENAVLNLAINARDAMPEGGRLTIEVGNAAIDDAYAQRHPEATPGQYVMLAVTDTGTGIAPAVLERVFEPFFSTKDEGRGSGLGLSMVYGFVRQSGGHVRLESELGRGTTVRLYLPRAHAEEDAPRPAHTGPATGGTETILVAEDDEGVRDTVVEMLEELGYRVLKVPDAAMALHTLEAGAGVDLLFTDVVMPGPLKSPELARLVRERFPAVAILFTSGYAENSIVHGGKLDPGVELLSKPYTREALARKIRDVLATRRAAAGTGPGAREAAPASLNVLAVEDEPLIRMAVADTLRDLGHQVVEAGDAREALAALEASPVDVLVTDLGLPGMSGAELARRARARHPALGVVFATGGNETLAELGISDAQLLTKPFDDEALARALHAAQRAPGVA